MYCNWIHIHTYTVYWRLLIPSGNVSNVPHGKSPVNHRTPWTSYKDISLVIYLSISYFHILFPYICRLFNGIIFFWMNSWQRFGQEGSIRQLLKLRAVMPEEAGGDLRIVVLNHRWITWKVLKSDIYHHICTDIR